MKKENQCTTSTNYVRVNCKVCNGSGVITICENTNGTLKTYPDKCRACNGTGTEDAGGYKITWNTPIFTC